MFKNLTVIIFILLTSLAARHTLVLAQSGIDQYEVFISEFSTSDTESKSNEFIEVDWSSLVPKEIRIEYQPLTSSNWYKRAQVELPAGFGRVLFLTGSEKFGLTSGLADSGGKLRIMIDDEEKDLVIWQEGIAVSSSYKRLMNQDGYPQTCPDTDCTVLVESTEPTPNAHLLEFTINHAEPDTSPPEDAPEQPSDDKSDSDAPNQDEQETNDSEPADGPEAVSSKSLTLTEVFPDPKSPQKDSDDEFVEVYNFGNAAINLDNFSIVSGSKLNVRANLSGLLEPGAYRAFKSSEFNMSLINSGGSVQLFFGDTLIDSVDYLDAISGSSYQLVENSWLWGEPSPGLANSGSADGNVSSDIENNLAADSTSTSTDNQDPAVAISGDNLATFAANLDPAPQPADAVVLASVGLFTVFYLMYEYRTELRVKGRELRAKLANSKLFRKALKRWRSN